MAKANPEQTKILANIFEEAEEAKVTNQDLDNELRLAGIDSNALVKDVLILVDKFSNIKHLNQEGYQLPIAASKRDTDTNKNDMIEFLKKGKKSED